jgi:tetrapyrrole methylase family protein/MazG family protein
VLLEHTEVYLRTIHHPAVPELPAHLSIHSFDHLYASEDDFPQVYNRITEEILKLGQRSQGVVYAVPGHPFVAETTCVKIYHQAREVGINVRIVEGISFIESTLAALGLDPFPQLSIVDALELGMKHTPGFPPDQPVLIGQIYSQQIASDVKLTLMEVYPDEHPVRIVHNAGTDDLIVEELFLYQIDRSPQIGMLTSLFVPPLENGTSFESFQDVIAHLRAPDGCPWDREQTHLSLRPNLLEETYEALSALDQENYQAMQEEFGDLLLQIVLHAQIASENGNFTIATIIKGIHDKLIRRHPHVFGNLEVENVEQVLKNWEKFKAEERKQEAPAIHSLLDGVALNLPALAQAEQYQSRVARTGFDWVDNQVALDIINSLLGTDPGSKILNDQEEAIGELLFIMTALARQYGVDPESALRLTNERFRNRFKYVENLLQQDGRHLQELSREEYKRLWQHAKSIYS